MPSFNPHLFDLPFDILDLILVKLDTGDLQSLSRTCRYMQRMVELHHEKEDARKPSKRRRRRIIEVGPDVDDEEEDFYEDWHYTGDGYFSDRSKSDTLPSYGSNYPSEDEDEFRAYDNLE